jgi:hypothetical protein
LRPCRNPSATGPVSGRAHRKGEHDQGGGHGEGEPRGKATQETVAAQHTEGKADLAGGRSGKKLAERDQIGKGALVDPLAAHHQFIPVVAEMGDRTAERSQAQLQECREDFTQMAIGSILAHRQTSAISVGASSLRR